MFNFGSRSSTSGDTPNQVYEQQSENGGIRQFLGIGAALRERREAMGVSLAEVESATRIRQKYLAALESDEWHLLPGEVVGRGFLRNYSGYLGLEPMDIIDQRRELTDESLSSALSNTSAGSSLPPIRQVDYRPKDVELKDEGNGIERSEIRLTPYLLVLGAVLLAMLLWWGRDPIGGAVSAAVGGIQDQLAGLQTSIRATPTLDVQAGVVNPENVGGASATEETGQDDSLGGAESTTETAATPQTVAGAALLPTPTMMPEPTATTDATATPIPTQTPLPTPTEEVFVLPTPTPVPIEPTPTEIPEPITAPICADARSVIASPGVGQVVSGVASVTGTATHDAFQYYKMEYAPGTDAAGGYVYFDGANAPVSGGLLGNLDTTGLPNGAYTLQLIVVDQTGNFPPPCRVSVTIQN